MRSLKVNIFVKESYNNVFITLTDLRGRVILKLSQGLFKESGLSFKRSKPFFYDQIIKRLVLQLYDLGLFKIGLNRFLFKRFILSIFVRIFGGIFDKGLNFNLTVDGENYESKSFEFISFWLESNYCKAEEELFLKNKTIEEERNKLGYIEKEEEEYMDDDDENFGSIFDYEKYDDEFWKRWEDEEKYYLGEYDYEKEEYSKVNEIVNSEENGTDEDIIDNFFNIESRYDFLRSLYFFFYKIFVLFRKYFFINIILVLNGFFSRRLKHLIINLDTFEFLNIYYLVDFLPVAHNGCRPKKIRRL